MNALIIGQKVDGTGQLPIPVASDGLSVPVSGTLTAVVDESTLATSAKQDTSNTSLGSIDTKLSSQATAANQTTGNTSLASIKTDLDSILANQTNGTGQVRSYLATSSVVELLSGADATSPASAGSATTTPVTGMSNVNAYSFIALLKGATGGTLDVLIEMSNDGTNWYEFAHFAQQAGSAAQTIYYVTKIIATQVITAGIGLNNTTTMTLAASSVISPPYFDRFRVRYVAGSGTSAGASGLSIQVIKWRMPMAV